MNKVKLGDVCTKASSNIKQSDLSEIDGDYPIYGASGLIKYIDYYIQDKPYVALVKDGAGVGRVFKCPAYSSVIGTMQYIIPNDGIDVSYLAYALEHMNLAKYYSGATIPHIYFKDYKKETFILRDYSEQLTVADTFNKLQRLIDLNQRSIAKLDELIKSRFVEMFGDVINNNKGWAVSTLGEIAEIKIGPFGSLLHKEDYIEGGHALVNPSHIISGKIITDEKLTVSEKKYKEMFAYHLKCGDVVLGRRGEMGRCAVVQSEGLLCGTGSMILRPKGTLKAYFLQNILSSSAYKKIIEDKAVGVTMLNLNVPIVSSLTVPLLPINLQEQFIVFLHKVEQQKATVQKSIDKLETLKKSLMQEYFG